MSNHDIAASKNDLEQLLSTQELRHALNEAAWAGRFLLNADASIIFLPVEGRLTAITWHGREAGEASILVENSAALKMLAAGRRSVAWDALEHCTDGEIAAVLTGLGLESGLTVSLRVYDTLVGLWLVGGGRGRSFDSQDELALTTLAENIGLTIKSLLLSAENLRYRSEADALYQIGQEISELRDLDKVLEVIAARASKLLQGEISYIALADDEAQAIRVRVTHGTRSDLLRHMVLKYGAGVGGFVAATRTPLLLDNYPSDTRPKPPGIAEIVASEDIVSVVCVPMYTRRRLTGVLYVASRRESAFRRSQLDLLNALGAQAAIAIENARLYEAEKVAAETLRALNAALESERSMMRASRQAHEQLLKLVLENQGLQVIADTLSQLLCCPVAVDDYRFRPLSLSAKGGVGRSLPGSAIEHIGVADILDDGELQEQVRALREDHRTVRVPARPARRIMHSRMVAPIVAGATLAGYVTVLEVDGELDEQGRSTLERASIVLALEFLKQEAVQAADQRLERDLLDDLLLGQGGDDPAIYQRAARLNMDLHRPHRALVFDIDDFAQAIAVHGWTDIEALACKRTLLTTAGSMLREQAAGSAAGRRGDSVVALVPERGGLREALALASGVQESFRASFPSLTISVGVGRVSTSPVDLPHSYADALTSLRAGRTLGAKDRVIAFEELGVVPLLLQSGDQAGLVGFMERYLRPLMDYDASHGTQLVQTLDRYLANNGNLQRTAAACYVHLNSLKYRVQRIGEITGLSLADAETRFNLRLALAIHSTLGLVSGQRQ